MESVTAFAPATVSNVACGFDVLGFALHEPGDEVTVRSNGTSVRLRARLNRELRSGVVRIAEPHAGDLQPTVELVK